MQAISLPIAELKPALTGLSKQRQKPDEAAAYLGEIFEADVLRFSKEQSTSREVRNLAFASFTSDEYPTHRMLQELMQRAGASDDVRELAERLLPWCADGNYGRLFDGASNVSLTGKIAFRTRLHSRLSKGAPRCRRLSHHQLYPPAH
jgi:hypothetical protein